MFSRHKYANLKSAAFFLFKFWHHIVYSCIYVRAFIASHIGNCQTSFSLQDFVYYNTPAPGCHKANLTQPAGVCETI